MKRQKNLEKAEGAGKGASARPGNLADAQGVMMCDIT